MPTPKSIAKMWKNCRSAKTLRKARARFSVAGVSDQRQSTSRMKDMAKNCTLMRAMPQMESPRRASSQAIRSPGALGNTVCVTGVSMRGVMLAAGPSVYKCREQGMRDERAGGFIPPATWIGCAACL